jgi:hypothetical protein
VAFARRDVRELIAAGAGKGAGGSAGEGEDVCASASLLAGVDAIVGLHACGALTDRVLDLARAARASFLVVPCCFCRGAAAGIGLAAEEACTAAGVGEEERAALCALAESNGPAVGDGGGGGGSGADVRSLAVRAMTLLNSLRLARAGADGARLRLRLRAFDEAFSPRNQALAGVVERE